MGLSFHIMWIFLMPDVIVFGTCMKEIKRTYLLLKILSSSNDSEYIIFMYIVWVVNINCWNSWTVCNTCVFLLVAFRSSGYVTCRSLVFLSLWWGGACVMMHRRDERAHVNVHTHTCCCAWSCLSVHYIQNMKYIAGD
jgi:hypothetical protein